METSILIAKIIGIIYCSFGIGLLFNRKYYQTEIPKLFDSAGYLVLGGWMAIIVGILLVEYQGSWNNNWTDIITVIGYIALIKGFLILAFPKMLGWYKPMFASKSFYNFLAPFVLLFGLLFLYFAFFLK